MPPAAKKDCGIIMFDLASSRKQELLCELIRFSTTKWFLNSKSLYRLILINSAETSNPKKYPGISVSKIEDFDPRKIIELIESTETGQADWIDAVSLGIYFLKQGIGTPGLVTLQLIYFSTLDSFNTSTFDQKKITKIISECNEHNLYFYLIGPEVELPFTITNSNSVSKCMKEIQVDETNQNLVIAKKIVSEISTALICDAKLSLHFLTTFKKFPGTQPWKVPMKIGSNLEIPACTAKIYRKDISLKLQSGETKQFQKRLADDRGVKVEECDVIKGLVLHNKFFQLDTEMFKMDTERCFDIIGFTSKEFIPEAYISGGETFYILPNETNDDDFQLFTHLVDVLQETNKYGIIKRVYSTNNRPRYFALIPNSDHHPKCLTMAGLPPGEQLIPHKYNTPDNKTKIEEDDFNMFFNSLIVDDTSRHNPRIPLGPTLTVDYYQQKLINATANKYLERDLNFEDPDNLVDNFRLDQALEAFKQSWPERTLD